MPDTPSPLFSRAAVLFLVLLTSPCRAETPLGFEQILTLEPDIEAGRARFESCSHCHGANGWGAYSGASRRLPASTRVS